ncbi:MAG: FMN-binding glutamate synthase family protein [Enterobacterales bacterium]|nr:FMN-binding glutamate synthase family protein [Enterobacterales bacterium]
MLNPLRVLPNGFISRASTMNARQVFYTFILLSSASVYALDHFWSVDWLFYLIASIALLGFYDMLQTKHTLLRLYPVIGHFRYLLESIRPEIQQYFVESDINGRPVSREFRSLVYQRAKGVRDTRPFGTLFDVYRDGYEWTNHSLAPCDVHSVSSKVTFGGAATSQPYQASVFNISAMSFGALSRHAIMALNQGAKIGGFAHNTGEGGLSPHHLKHGGDLIWQIGTGYFGCRTSDGHFDEKLFAETASQAAVKMIEIKLSQGAKPGHGGILPAIKLTQEIATIRKVPMGHDVISPAAHSAFSTPQGLLDFVKKLRQLSGGKPVGFKLCIGDQKQFMAVAKAMLKSKIYPDFITVDGSEGGTGAAPVELTNSVGTPLKDGLVFVNNLLIGLGLRNKLKLIASGKVFSSFHLLRLLALGADSVNSARAMMFALGCIQSRSCNSDRCPTGIATQDPSRYKALDVNDKAKRVAQYHDSIVENLHELLAASGLAKSNQLKPEHIFRRVQGAEVKTYAELYAWFKPGQLLDDPQQTNISTSYLTNWQQADPNHW